MPIAQHVQALEQRRQKLQERIHAEEIRPAPDPEILHQLKTENLNLKDKIARLVREQTPSETAAGE